MLLRQCVTDHDERRELDGVRDDFFFLQCCRPL